ncbi:MAG: hypothetical protein ACOYEB_12685, partial [Enterococcus lemanii]
MNFIIFALFLHRQWTGPIAASCAISGDSEEKNNYHEDYLNTLKINDKNYVQTIKYCVTRTMQRFLRKHVRFFKFSNIPPIPKQTSEMEALQEGNYNDTVIYENRDLETKDIARPAISKLSKTLKIDSAGDIHSNDRAAGCTKFISKEIPSAYIILFKKTEKYA